MSVKASGENYLETIYNIKIQKGVVRSIDVANELNVSRPSVNRAMSVLIEEKMIEKEHYGTITLTEKGETLAKEVKRRHNLLRDFFIKVLDVPIETAQEDACEIEHVISSETITKLSDYIEKVLK